MQIFELMTPWKELRPTLQGSVGLVPTMGALHEGHLSLVRRAREENDLVVVWIFVNPKQFNQQADFTRYPRDAEADLTMLRAEGVDYVLMPAVNEVYPEGFQTYVTVEGLTEPLEGVHRPGHFRGVTTVVAKMLSLTQCHRAYFGQKDAQQSLVVTRMAADLDLLTRIVVCPTVRESDGLAMSSRNVLLSPQDRADAAILYQSLLAVEKALKAGERDGEALRQVMRMVIGQKDTVRIEYVSIANPETLSEYGQITGPVLASLAVYIGTTRLIDNILVENL